MYYKNIDDAVALYLHRNGMRQDDFAAMMGMAPNTFSWKRRGLREFSLSEASELCDIVGITLDQATGRAPVAG